MKQTFLVLVIDVKKVYGFSFENNLLSTYDLLSQVTYDYKLWAVYPKRLGATDLDTTHSLMGPHRLIGPVSNYQAHSIPVDVSQTKITL